MAIFTEVKRVVNWTNKTQAGCSCFAWVPLEDNPKTKVAKCKSSDNPSGKCVYAKCPKVIKNKDK